MLHPRFYRNDSVLSDVIGYACDNQYWTHVFMAGEMTRVFNDGLTDGNVGILSEKIKLKIFSFAIFPVHTKW